MEGRSTRLGITAVFSVLVAFIAVTGSRISFLDKLLGSRLWSWAGAAFGYAIGVAGCAWRASSRCSWPPCCRTRRRPAGPDAGHGPRGAVCGAAITWRARRRPPTSRGSGTACTPDSVHPLRDWRIISLMRPPGGCPGLAPGRARAARAAQLPCSRRGLPMPRSSRSARWALTPPFHPYPLARAVIFCGTVRRRGLWSPPPRLSTGVVLDGVRKFLPPFGERPPGRP